ncbi:MAG TPA: hypothetical protein H9829_11470 [Candidatus Tetragenococcus pullicola]|nr:hypothetical protein [Candidatus Tetragenococcus pullicola]
MTKYLLVIVSLIVLTACSKNENSSEVNSTSTLSTATEASTTFSTSDTKSNSEQSKTSISSENTEKDYPYAVDLNDFVQKIKPNETDEKNLYHLAFVTNQKNVPTAITLNTKDLNNLGKGIYITSNGKELFYPISITEIPTKEILLVGDNEKERKIQANTEVKIEMPENQSDPLQIVGDAYYLFYNQQETISLAARNFSENPGSENIDNNMIEYVQQVDSQNTEEMKEEKPEKTDESSNIIDTINLTTKQVEDWIYYHENLFWKEKGQDLIRGDINYNFQKESNQTLKVSLVTKWQPLGIYTINENGELYREDPRSGEKTFVTDEYDAK